MKTRQIGEVLKSRRVFLSISQQDLAEMSNVTIKTIHLIESGKGNPSLETLEKLCRVLGTEILIQVKKID